ncbi:hypothetical protein FA09DRAFT_188345 [Tilletiopsis washingtonensis]|uniref:RRM domain-containing protein n=1 Tax=Tilletiopsis washingtonensis TaxID=58919 RepID=A0A316ZJP1_9BASI|nr:hypothetical protein FA09DRAFT_188345 [Tilletiopsis washingtonensis]PWO00504.1 hypothetical protein FA09DRAFT_188345 [Tilletiopsis washingtonensis]
MTSCPPTASRAPLAVAAVLATASRSSAAAAARPVCTPRLPRSARRRSFGSKIIVSNLPIDVTEPQVKELFSTSIGPLKKVVMSFRANGTSTGTVTVEFQRAEDANRAYQQYNNRLIDGKKAIRIEVVVDPARAAAMAQQQAALAAQSQSMRAPAAPRAPRGGAAAGARGGRGAARGGRAPREPKPKKTLEDLDAEMEDYSTKAGEANQA